MPLQEQAELWMALRDRMKENWSNLTVQEKKAGKSCRKSFGTASANPGTRRPMADEEKAGSEDPTRQSIDLNWPLPVPAGT